MTMDAAAAKMNVSCPPGAATMTINTYGANKIVSSSPPLRNKGRVNHTVGVNFAFDGTSSIVCNSVKPSTDEPRTDATGFVQPIMIKKETNAMKRAEEISSHNNDYNDRMKPSNPQYNTTTLHVQVSSSPTSVSDNAKNEMELKDTSLVSSPQNCSQSKSKNVKSETEVLPKKNIPETKTESPPPPKMHRISPGKVEQRYDMNLVPMVKKNPDFLRKWRQASLLTNTSRPVFSSLPNLVPCDNASNCDASTDTKSTSSENLPCPTSSSDQEQDHSAASSAKQCHHACHVHSKEKPDDLSRNTAYIPTLDTPFAEDCVSCIWAPSSRADWEDCIDELVNVCTAASWHRERLVNKKKSKEISPPISHIYVKDRLDIDDPLRGYQIRHKTGGWLQGFVMMTNFTIWTHYFKWDSVHPMNGIDRQNIIGLVDDGTMTQELEGQPRSGDPHGAGVVWPTIAEISLVGALGCGEYLVQMALDDIERRGTYEYVVLEATEKSRPFYEKLGFARVGAVCKYGKKEDFADNANSVEVTGYRHWTYANETKARLNEHGGPSCMMARRVMKRDHMGRKHCQSCGKLIEAPSFIDKLANYFVTKKPKIEPLGSSGNRKRSRTASAGSLALVTGEKSAKMQKTAKDLTRMTSSGRQTRTPTRLEESPENVALPARSKNQNSSRSSRNSASASLPVQQKSPSPRINNKPILRKQKIANMYRDPKKTYYYNKVVTPTRDDSDKYNYKSIYYFVLDFAEDVKLIRVIPLYRKGTFKGKREGREKWKAKILPRVDADEKKWLKSMDVITSPASKWSIVPSYMVTKCSSVGDESWDIL